MFLKVCCNFLMLIFGVKWVFIRFFGIVIVFLVYFCCWYFFLFFRVVVVFLQCWYFKSCVINFVWGFFFLGGSLFLIIGGFGNSIVFLIDIKVVVIIKYFLVMLSWFCFCWCKNLMYWLVILVIGMLQMLILVFLIRCNKRFSGFLKLFKISVGCFIKWVSFCLVI